jgi:hypothetical protein
MADGSDHTVLGATGIRRCRGRPAIAFVKRGNRLHLLQIGRYCLSDGVPRRWLFVALIVGTVLNLINQGEVPFRDGKLNLVKIVLTYAVRA